MKISDNLTKKFIDVSIKLTEKEKEAKFLRQVNPNSLIKLAIFFRKKENVNFVKLSDLQDLHDQDSAIKIDIFYLIQSIEEKLTGYIIQHIAYPKPDFHLQAKNFKLFSVKKISQFKNINKFILDLRKEHNLLIKNNIEIPKEKYIELHDLISKMSLGMKAKLIKYAKEEFSEKVLTGFNMIGSQLQKSFTFDFFMQLNILRNRVAHHDVVLDFKWKSSYGHFNLFDFIKIARYFAKNQKINYFLNLESHLKNVNQMSKKEIKKLLKET